MLTIGSDQWKALTDAGLLRFEGEMVEHLSGFAPQLAKVMGSRGLHELVRRGIPRGRAHGFSQRGPLRTYLETMLALGSDFDTDPALVRATVSLRNRNADADPMQSAAAFHRDIVAYCEQVNGAANEHAFAAMRRVQEVPYEALSGGANLGERALALFRAGFPQKFAYTGEAAMRQLLAEAARVSERFEVRSDSGRLVTATMLYAFGHGVFDDPAYPWVAEAMRNVAVAAEERPRHLQRKARLYLSAALANLMPG